MSLACVLVSQIHPRGIHPLSNLATGHKELLSDCKVTVLHKYFPSPPKTCWLREYQTEGENTDVFVTYIMWFGVFWLVLNNGGFFSRELEVLKLHWNLNLTHPMWTVQTHSLLAQLGQLRWLSKSAAEHDFTSRSPVSCSSALFVKDHSRNFWHLILQTLIFPMCWSGYINIAYYSHSYYKLLYEVLVIFIVTVSVSKSPCVYQVLFYLVMFRCFVSICSAFDEEGLDGFSWSSPRIHSTVSKTPSDCGIGWHKI